MSEILAFTADHVVRLAGLSKRQLGYWDSTGFFSPTIVDGFGRRTFGRIYSFRDLVGLRTIAILRNQYGIPLQELRRVGEWLQRHYDSPWSSLRFGLNGRQVAFTEPESGTAVEAREGGQTVFSVALEPIATEMDRASRQLIERTPEQIGRIERHRHVVHNKDVVAGTRIPTQAIWSFHQAGYRQNAIINEFPRLKPADVRAAIAFEKKRQAA
jgi:uncharacterized protein (DUF433 family)